VTDPTDIDLSSKSTAELQEMLRAVQPQYETAARKSPVSFFRPNAVQKRINLMLEEGIKAGCRSFGILPGNGIGKSTDMAHLIWNIANHGCSPYWKSLDFVRHWPFRPELRITCNALEIKEETGALWKAIYNSWPHGQFSSEKQGFDYEALFRLPNGFTLSIRTFNQPWAAHESDTLGALFMSEAPEEPTIWRQYGPRLRGSGFRSLWSTIWRSGQLWVQEEIVDNPLARHCFGDIEECCRDHYPDGHMSHAEVEAVIADYVDDEREARRTGKFAGLTQHIFKVPEDIDFDDEDQPEHLSGFGSLDPHPVKPWVYLIGGLDEIQDWWILDEWPHGDYLKINRDDRGIDEYASIISGLDSQWGTLKRVIDRAGANQQIRRSDYGSTTVRQELDGRRIRFEDGNRHIQDAGKDVGGITFVKTLLQNNKLHIHRRCANTKKHLVNLSRKKDSFGRLTDEIDDKFLDYVRNLMYLVMAGFKYRPMASAEQVRTSRLTAHERELLRIKRKRDQLMTPVSAGHPAAPINWNGF
jgi:hypothetical protein